MKYFTSLILTIFISILFHYDLCIEICDQFVIRKCFGGSACIMQMWDNSLKIMSLSCTNHNNFFLWRKCWVDSNILMCNESILTEIVADQNLPRLSKLYNPFTCYSRMLLFIIKTIFPENLNRFKLKYSLVKANKCHVILFLLCIL